MSTPSSTTLPAYSANSSEVSLNQLLSQQAGGKLLSKIKKQLVAYTKVGTKLEDIDQLAEKLILESGGQPSFKTVPGYHWSTCINVNSGLVHGIPKGALKDSDLVTIDVGLFYRGYHTDTSTSFVVGKSSKHLERFLLVGKKTLKKAINKAKPGNHIYDISHTIQKNIEREGFSVVRNLTGHGIGKQLHQEPAIPCFTDKPKAQTPVLIKNQVVAIEVMYCLGGHHTTTSADNWTISTQDGQLSAVFEETVIVAKNPKIIT